MAEVGRPTLMTQETIDKLEYVFAMGGTDKEACLYADISHQTLYDYQKNHPEFVERKERLKETPVLKARQTVVSSLAQPQTAQWYLERKKKDEFSSRVENTGKDGSAITFKIISFGDNDTPQLPPNELALSGVERPGEIQDHSSSPESSEDNPSDQ